MASHSVSESDCDPRYAAPTTLVKKARVGRDCKASHFAVFCMLLRLSLHSGRHLLKGLHRALDLSKC